MLPTPDLEAGPKPARPSEAPAAGSSHPAPVASPPPPPEIPSAVIDAGDEFAEVVIEAPQGWVAVDWEELARSRELLYFFAWRDVKVRYKQTVLGLSWAVLQPLTSMLIFTLVFGRYAGKLPGDVAYPIYVFAGLIPWAFFSNGLMASSQSLLNNQQLLAKIYFPRLFLPAATLGPFLVEMAVSLGLYAVILAVYRTLPSWHVIFLPVVIALLILAVVGLGCLLSALTVLYRDFRVIVPFVLQAMLFLSQVIIPLDHLPDPIRWLLAVNPMFGLVSAFRASVIGTPFDPIVLVISTASTLLVLAAGVAFFGRVERQFADIA